MSPVVVACALLVGAIVLAAATRRPWIAALAGGILLGPACYLAVGIGTARARGVGRFFRVPFGGETVRDGPMLLSAALWVLACGGVCYAAARLLRRRRPFA